MTSREPHEFPEDIVVSARLIQEYVRGLDFQAFVGDMKTRDSVVHRLELIGEAAGKLPPEVTSAIASVPWARIRGMRDLLAHQYWDIDLERVWAVVEHDLPTLLHNLEGQIP